MLQTLRKKQVQEQPITVGIVGLGAMGKGIAHQINITPGMQLAWVADRKLDNAKKVASTVTNCKAGEDANTLLVTIPVDVLVESTSSIQSALNYCETAIRNKSHVVLLNTQVDLAFGPYLMELAREHGVVVTSDAGDQHGVLASMIEEITLWGFEIIQAGNVKGFLNKEATIESLAHEAAIRNLSPIQCCAFTDGTKLNIEMAVLANAFGYLPTKPGMTGPRATTVEEALELFDFNANPTEGTIDYILGAEPGGGVYVIGKCDFDFQIPYLNYYKLSKSDQGNYYLFYRPYHLCHLETPKAVYQAAELGEAILQPWKGRVTEVYAYAKADFPKGTTIDESIGSNVVYGMVKSCKESAQQVPLVILEVEGEKPLLARDVIKDQPLSFDDIHWPDKSLYDKYFHPLNQPSK